MFDIAAGYSSGGTKNLFVGKYSKFWCSSETFFMKQNLKKTRIGCDVEELKTDECGNSSPCS